MASRNERQVRTADIGSRYGERTSENDRNDKKQRCKPDKQRKQKEYV